MSLKVRKIKIRGIRIMNIKIFNEIEDYNKCVEELNCEYYPVLSENGNIQSNINELLEEINSNNLLNKNKLNFITSSCIFVFKNSNCSSIAKLHSIFTNQRLYKIDSIMEIENLIKNYEFITLVGLPTEIRIEDVFYLQSLRNKLEKNFDFSLLIHKDIYLLSELIIKNELSKYCKERDSLFIDRLNFDRSQSNSNNFNFYNSHTNLINDVISNNKIDLFSIIGHGRDEFIWLKDGVICGKNSQLNLYNKQSEKPCCYYTGNCYKSDLKVLPGAQLKALHFFMNSCYSSLIDESSFGLNYNILYAVLSGEAVSYLGSTSAVDGTSVLNHYYAALIKSGFPLGSAASKVNDTYSNYKFGQNSAYYLIGDCTYKFTEDLCRVEVDVEDPFSTVNVNVKPYSRIIILNFKEKNILNRFLDFSLRVDLKSSIKEEFYLLFNTKKDGSELHIFTNDYIKSEAVTIRFSENKELNLHLIENLKSLSSMGIPVNREYESLLKETSDFVNKLTKIIKYERTEISKIRKLYKRIDNVNKRVETLCNILLKNIQNAVNSNSFSYEETLLENGFIFSKQLLESKKCFNCNRKLYIDEYTNLLYTNYCLHYTCCPNCGVIKVEDKENKSIDITINGPNLLTNNDLEIFLEIHNLSNETKEIHYCFSITRSIENGIFVDDEIKYISIPSQTKIKIPAKIQKSEYTVPHVYWLKVNMMLDAKIVSLKKDIYVGL